MIWAVQECLSAGLGLLLPLSRKSDFQQPLWAHPRAEANALHQSALPPVAVHPALPLQESSP